MAEASFLDRHHFLLRRLHSLTGIVPVGVFLLEHLFTNSLAALGPAGAKFNEHVHWIHELPYLILLEVFGIFLPLFYHAGYGILIAFTGRSNATQYPYVDNWRYTLQRLTGYVAFVYIIIHLAHFRFGYLFGGPEYVGTPDPFGQMQAGFTNQAYLPMWLWMTFYTIGLAASVFHFANGITTFCITWGITVNDSSRRKVSLVSAGLGVVMLVWGLMALWAIANKLPADHDAESHIVRADSSDPRLAVETPATTETRRGGAREDG